MLSEQEKSLYIPLVDETDRLIGYETKEIVHEQGLLHRAFSIFVYRYVNNRLEFLLQKRAHLKYHSANLWTNTCCSHPYWKELSVEQNAMRRLNEEFGFTCPLQKVGCFTYRATFCNSLIEHEFDHVFIGDYAEKKGNLIPIPEEIAEHRWVSTDEINSQVQDRPERFTSWFEEAFKLVKTEMDRK